jgi:hypothetical protein
VARHKKSNTFAQQLVNAKPVPAFAWIQRLKMRLKFFNELHGINGIGPFFNDNRWHRSPENEKKSIAQLRRAGKQLNAAKLAFNSAYIFTCTLYEFA